MENPNLKQIKISASFTGTIPGAAYENAKPFFSAEETWENPPENGGFIKGRQDYLNDICQQKFKEIEQKMKAEKLQKVYNSLRFYEFGGKQYPSVTSIINWDFDFPVSPDHLTQYAARGTIIHKQVEVFLETGEWKSPKELPEIYKELLILDKGDLNLDLDDTNFPAFFQKHPFDTIWTEKTLYNHNNLYAGRCDIKGIMDGKVTLFDVKTGKSMTKDMKIKFFKQLTAYAHTEGNEDVEQLCIIHLNGNTKQGFSAPIIEEDVDKYFPMFLDDRKVFKQNFGF